MSEVDKKLMDPAANELIPGGPEPGPPNDLCPNYVEPPLKKMVQTEDLMSLLTDAAAGKIPAACSREEVDLGGGLKASSCPAGGLSIFKDGVQVHGVEGLSAEDQRAINEYRERNK